MGKRYSSLHGPNLKPPSGPAARPAFTAAPPWKKDQMPRSCLGQRGVGMEFEAGAEWQPVQTRGRTWQARSGRMGKADVLHHQSRRGLTPLSSMPSGTPSGGQYYRHTIEKSPFHHLTEGGGRSAITPWLAAVATGRGSPALGPKPSYLLGPSGRGRTLRPHPGPCLQKTDSYP